MTDRNQSTSQMLLVAIDIAKRFNEIVVKWPDGRLRGFKAANVRSEHDELCQFLNSQGLPS